MQSADSDTPKNVQTNPCCPSSQSSEVSKSSCCGSTTTPIDTEQQEGVISTGAEKSASCCDNSDLTSSSEDKASAVQFKNDRRVHISLNVKDLRRSLPFYKILFNQNPTNLKDDYAKFEPDEPPVNFTINQHNEEIVDNDGHFGIEVKSVEVVNQVLNRLKKSGISVEATETQVACCHAIQDKGWVKDPDGNHWEFFVVTENEAEEGCGLTCICYDPETDGCTWQKSA